MTELVSIKQPESDNEELETTEMTTDSPTDENFITVKGEPPKKSSKTKTRPRRGIRQFQEEWFDEFPSWKEWVVRLKNESQFYCKICEKTMSCGRKEIVNHEKTRKHTKKKEILDKMDRYCYTVRHVSDGPVMYAINEAAFAKKPEEPPAPKGPTFKEKLRDAEHKITQFFVDNNIPFMLSPKIVNLFREIEPLVLKRVTLSSSKMSVVAKEIHAAKNGGETIIFPKIRKKNKPILVAPKAMNPLKI